VQEIRLSAPEGAQTGPLTANIDPRDRRAAPRGPRLDFPPTDAAEPHIGLPGSLPLFIISISVDEIVALPKEAAFSLKLPSRAVARLRQFLRHPRLGERFRIAAESEP
jgi:hypothetical protein